MVGRLAALVEPLIDIIAVSGFTLWLFVDVHYQTVSTRTSMLAR